MSEILGFDVSENNDLSLYDFQLMKQEGAEFVVIRSSYGLRSKDSRFAEYCSYADQVGLRKMAYHYSYGTTPYEISVEAQNCRDTIAEAGVSLERVFYDCEEEALRGWATDACRVFLDNIGLNCGIYASLSWFEDEIDWYNLYQEYECPIWVAQYNSNCDLKGYMWQFTDNYILPNGTRLDANKMFC